MRTKNMLKEVEHQNIFSIVLLSLFLCVSNSVLALSIKPALMINPFWELIQSIFEKTAIIFIATLTLGIIDVIRVKIGLKKNKENVKIFYKKFFIGALVSLIITLIAFVLMRIIPPSVEIGILFGRSLRIISMVAALLFFITLILGIIDFTKGKNKENVKKRYKKFFIAALINLYIFVVIFFS